MEKAKRASTVLGFLLFLSLAGNVFLGGLALGRHATPPRQPRAAIMSAVSNLSPASRNKARVTLHADMPAIRKNMEMIRAQREQLRVLLAAPDYDHEKAAALMAQIRDNVAATQKMAQDMMLDIEDEVTPAERADLVKSLPAQWE